MNKNLQRGKKIRRPIFIEKKYLLMLACFALMFSPFSSIGDLVYAEDGEEQENLKIEEYVEQANELEEKSNQEGELDDANESGLASNGRNEGSDKAASNELSDESGEVTSGDDRIDSSD